MTTSEQHRTPTLLFPYTDEEQSVETRLVKLAEQWNPLVGSKSRYELRGEVNSLIYDEVQRIQRFLFIKPNDTERVENLSELISRKRAFSTISRKKEFLEYIQLYVVKVLRSSRAALLVRSRA